MSILRLSALYNRAYSCARSLAVLSRAVSPSSMRLIVRPTNTIHDIVEGNVRADTEILELAELPRTALVVGVEIARIQSPENTAERGLQGVHQNLEGRAFGGWRDRAPRE
jgi:hypothetical protein